MKLDYDFRPFVLRIYFDILRPPNDRLENVVHYSTKKKNTLKKNPSLTPVLIVLRATYNKLKEQEEK